MKTKKFKELLSSKFPVRVQLTPAQSKVIRAHRPGIPLRLEIEVDTTWVSDEGVLVLGHVWTASGNALV